MELEQWNSTLYAKKSWFMFDDEVVALGSDISSKDNRTIETIIDNRRIKETGDNSLTVNGIKKAVELGTVEITPVEELGQRPSSKRIEEGWSETMDNVQWVHLEGNVDGADIGYYFPTQSTIKGLRDKRIGSEAVINYGRSQDPIIKNYVTLWFDHGINPNKATYEYVILPNKTEQEIKEYAENSDIVILENSPEAHAVKEKNLNITAVNFWEDMKKRVANITSNRKASVMLEETKYDITVSVSEPTRENMDTIEVEIHKPGYYIVSKDENITITQMRPTIKLLVDVKNSNGASFSARIITDVNMSITYDIINNINNTTCLFIESPNAIVNNVRTKIDDNNPKVKPIIDNGRIMVPLCFISKSFGARISFDENARKIQIIDENQVVMMSLNDENMFVNGEHVDLQAPAKVIQGNVFVPLRALAEVVGKNVFWNFAIKAFQISTLNTGVQQIPMYTHYTMLNQL